MIALLALTAVAAEPLPRHIEIDAIIGMRAGGAVLYTVEPVEHLEVGTLTTLTTDVYAGAPRWVMDGLDPKHNLHLAPMAAAGWTSGRKAVNLSVLATAGLEISSFREVRTLDALPEPVAYGTTGARFSGGLALDLRVRPAGKLGGNMQIFVPLPLAATGAPYIDRIHVGLGLSF